MFLFIQKLMSDVAIHGLDAAQFALLIAPCALFMLRPPRSSSL